MLASLMSTSSIGTPVERAMPDVRHLGEGSTDHARDEQQIGVVRQLLSGTGGAWRDLTSSRSGSRTRLLPVSRRAAELIEAVERGLIDGTSTTSLLQQCILLGSHSGSKKLREWAGRELNGYTDGSLVPDYRRIYAIICVDAIVGNGQITGQQIGSNQLPDFAKDAKVDENLHLRQGIGELEALVVGDRKSIKFSLPGATIIARALDRSSGRSHLQQITAIYWGVSSATIRGVIERIRTALAEFLAEVMDTLPADKGAMAAPTTEAVDRAVTVVLQSAGGAVTVNTGSSYQSDTTSFGDLSMGDKFENITNSTIVNRSSLTNALNLLDARGDDGGVAALTELERCVSESGDATAAEYLDGFNEELARTMARPAILRAMWEGIVRALPQVASVATISTGIGHLILQP